MTGCLQRMEFIFEQSVIIVASGAISVAFVQVNIYRWFIYLFHSLFAFEQDKIHWIQLTVSALQTMYVFYI